MGRRQCKSAYNIIKNKTTPESSPPPTPRSDYCNADKAEENDLKKSLMKMLEEAFEEKMKNVSKEIGENTNKKLEEINKEIEEKKSKKLEEMNNEIEEKKNKRVEEMNKEIEEKTNKKLEEINKFFCTLPLHYVKHSCRVTSHNVSPYVRGAVTVDTLEMTSGDQIVTSAKVKDVVEHFHPNIYLQEALLQRIGWFGFGAHCSCDLIH
ncbi:hypothetical protein STEG23_008978, partial [Scotinomys teguina]